jgi:hypothetical protein
VIIRLKNVTEGTVLRVLAYFPMVLVSACRWSCLKLLVITIIVVGEMFLSDNYLASFLEMLTETRVSLHVNCPSFLWEFN